MSGLTLFAEERSGSPREEHKFNQQCQISTNLGRLSSWLDRAHHPVEETLLCWKQLHLREDKGSGFLLSSEPR